jgi:hypothetical protein
MFLKWLENDNEDKQFRAAYGLLTMFGSFRPQPLPPRPPEDMDGPDIPADMT